MRISDWSSDVCSSDLASWTPLTNTSRGAGMSAIRAGSNAATAASTGAKARRSSARSGVYFHASLRGRSEEHTSELQTLMRISYAVFCLKKKNKENTQKYNNYTHRIIIYMPEKQK